VGSPLRTIDELVESLDTGEIEKAYDLDSPQGRNPFHPKTFIIDHSTIGYFLGRFHQQVVELFSQVVAICKEKGLIEFDRLAIDSVKMRANASYKQGKNLEGIEKEEQKIRRRLGELPRGVEKGREAEEREALERMRERLAKEENRAQFRLRAHAAESPYGNAKRNLKFVYVLRRGIEKVRMEMALLFMLHNGMKLRLCMGG